ncbi:Inositol hexakisphosphate and diphosphoinositol-pentakisphosphate kinase 1-like [Oopsacas minuta]|uniref:diphosphoinositol-pentakisphosphate 1-kinase n=1 Tax=Oopsacas minuta TaxID=111878 RepID=A0AAV7JGH6_9METZ|nr:Inositol hexakisphosphate and diphosphoinositol-pentakisphosphate kinase 1-like [Oopsacas minuta]
MVVRVALVVRGGYVPENCREWQNRERFSTDVESPKRHVRTRLYFTSESHVHSLFNIIKYGGLWEEADKEWAEARRKLDKISELNYNTQIIFHIYEDSTKLSTDPDKLYVIVYFSPGLKTLNLNDELEIVETKGDDIQQNICPSSESLFALPLHSTGSLDDLTDFSFELDNSLFRTTRKQSEFDIGMKLSKLRKHYSPSLGNLNETLGQEEEISDVPPTIHMPFRVGTSSLKQIKNHLYQLSEKKP